MWFGGISALSRRSSGGEEAQREDLLGLEGEGCYGGAGEASETRVRYIRNVDDYGGWGHSEIEAIGEIQVHSDLGADDELRVERWAHSGDAGDGEWGERDLG